MDSHHEDKHSVWSPDRTWLHDSVLKTSIAFRFFVRVLHFFIESKNFLVYVKRIYWMLMNFSCWNKRHPLLKIWGLFSCAGNDCSAVECSGQGLLRICFQNGGWGDLRFSASDNEGVNFPGFVVVLRRKSLLRSSGKYQSDRATGPWRVYETWIGNYRFAVEVLTTWEPRLEDGFHGLDVVNIRCSWTVIYHLNLIVIFCHLHLDTTSALFEHIDLIY